MSAHIKCAKPLRPLLVQIFVVHKYSYRWQTQNFPIFLDITDETYTVDSC
jgi:hypothetical protein